MCVKSLQSCLTLRDTMNCSPPGSPVHGILQARILEWVAMPFSRGSSWSRDPNYISYVCLVHWHAVSLLLTPSLGSLYVCRHVYIQYIYVFYAVLSHSDSNQGLNSVLPHCRQIFLPSEHQGSPRILEWAVYIFSRGSSQLRNQTGISCIAGRFFTSWATREAQIYTYVYMCVCIYIYTHTHTPSLTISRRCILIYTHTISHH